MKKYIVTTKGDDYGAKRTEIVETTKELAEEYYSHNEVPEEHAKVLMQYITFVDVEEEKERTNEERFYGFE